ncbi:MAG TPA: CBS domain-containing protein [Verrucomicrobiae bacterium]|nr:CBS domain-containing protein [Verrucomicrobiae bacterium]
MTRNPTTLDRNETLDLAESIMNLGRIRHMPVVDDGKVVGIVSQRDMFRSALITSLGFGRKTTGALMKTIKIKEIMTEKVVTISPDASIKEAARQMMEKKIGCLPVLEGDRLVGIVTETDMLQYVVEN